MKFEYKHPDAVYLEEFPCNGDSVIKSNDEVLHHCYVCEDKTSFISVSFETPVCSEECLDILWSRFDTSTH